MALLRDPGHRFSLDLTLSGAGTVESVTHALAVTSEGDQTRVQLAAGEVLPDRDCVLRWRTSQDAMRPTLQVWTHGDSAQTYFLALVAPPSGATSTIPREVILLVDHSGSMSGAKWAAADWAVKQFLAGLTAADAFALGLFHNDTRWYVNAPIVATPEAKQRAIGFLEEHRDSGGTELGVALEQALGLPVTEGEHACHVLIITDAEVTDTGRLLRLADEAMRPDLRRRISLLCIDAAPNAYLVHQLAERGGGVARFLTSAPDEEDITTALDEVLADWAQPIQANLRLAINRPAVQGAGRSTAGGVVDLGDLPAGRAIWASGRAAGDARGLAFHLLAGSDQEVGVWQGDAGFCPAIKALFGSHRILALEHLIHAAYGAADLQVALARLGYDPAEVLAASSHSGKQVYAENMPRSAEKALRALLVREALDFGLASSETAFVATRTEAGKPTEGTVLVTNALPASWSEEFLTLGLAGPGPVTRALGPAKGFVHSPARAAMEMDDLAIPAFLRRPLSSFDRAAAASASVPVFSGVPGFNEGQAVLFDSTRPADAAKIPVAGTVRQIQVRFTDATPRPEDLDLGLALLIFVDDLSSPRAKVRLADIVRQGGSRPLNLRLISGQIVRILLADPAGVWTAAAPAISVILEW